MLLALPLCFAALSKGQHTSTPPAIGTPAQRAPGQRQNTDTSRSQGQAAPPVAAQSAPRGTTPPQPLSIELYYWFTGGEPKLYGGEDNTAGTPTGIDFTGGVHRSPGVVVGIPAGTGNSLNFSYFQNVGTGNQTAQTDLTLFGTGFAPGDYLATRFRLQNVKISWDFLSYPTPLNNSSFRFRTLWEVQYTTMYSSIDAPLKAVSIDSSGNPIPNTGYGSRWIIYPTFGGAVEKTYAKRLRLEAKASAFGIPHHADIWDAEASAAVRARQLDLIGAFKGFHYKTSPKSDQYYTQTLSGAYVAIRWNFGARF